MIASVVQPVSRFGYSFAKTASLDTGSERMGEEDPPFHKKQEPLKISVKIIRGKTFLIFLRLRIFLNKSKRFWRLTENPEKFFRACEKFPEIFSGKIRTRAHPPTRIIPNPSKTGQNLIKPLILRGDLNRGV